MTQIQRSKDRPKRSKQVKNTTKTNPPPVVFKTCGGDTNACTDWVDNSCGEAFRSFHSKKDCSARAKFASII